MAENLRKVTVVWEEIPDSTKVFHGTVDEDLLTTLHECHGHHINAGEPDHMVDKFYDKSSGALLLDKSPWNLKRRENPVRNGGTVFVMGFIL